MRPRDWAGLIYLLGLVSCDPTRSPAGPTEEGSGASAQIEPAAKPVGIETTTLAQALRRLPQDRVLALPTYEGSGQAIHPDILYGRGHGLPQAFYLALTPYPFGRDRFENPSILVSDDGVSFREEITGLNPLAPAPATDHNSDTDLIYDAATRSLRIYYLESGRPNYNRVVLLESQDGLRWTRRTVLNYNLGAGENFIVSPAVVPATAGYRMFFVNITPKSHPVQVLSSTDGRRWDRKAARTVVPSLPGGLPPWHVDVFPADGRYLMLACGPYADPRVYLAFSDDLESWTFLQQPILRAGPAFHDTRLIYRSTGLAAGDELAVWYSFKDSQGRWGIGLKRFSLRRLREQDALR